MFQQARDVATLGGGCFWCLEAIFSEVKGVEKVEPGYAGGSVENPTYEQVCTGATGHAEVVQITFDPEIITYRQLLNIFFSVHDPTTPNRQGDDVGSQYRSIILYHSEEQRSVALEVIEELKRGKIWGDSSIVTVVEPFKVFYPAEQYHHNYFKRNPDKAYCRLVITPKVARFRKKYMELLRSSPAMT
ncbi:MAG: peptide-methionine (S)-S-oxide reductase MsrA [Nitrososphaerota archaeon]